MNLNSTLLAGPYTHENLTVFLICGRDALDGSRFLPLDEALEKKCVIVHETGEVGQLEVENLSETFDLYVQAGDIVKGGRQDRTLGVDFVLPARSGRVPIPSFCVERQRWHRREREEAGSFASSKTTLACKSLRLAAKLSKDQGEVWEKVAEAQASLGASLGKSVHSGVSPSSYQLSVEDKDLAGRKLGYQAALGRIVEEHPDAVGYAFAIDGVLNTADVYGSAELFRKLWGKLLDAAAIEAIAESRPAAEKPKRRALKAPTVSKWLVSMEQSEISDRQEVPPRVRIETRRSPKSFQFDTRDREFGDAVLHRNLVAG